MDLVLLDNEILNERYDCELCRSRFVRYAKEHPPGVVAVSHVEESQRKIWDKLKQSCPFVSFFLDNEHAELQLENCSIQLSQRKLLCGDTVIFPEPGAAVWIQTEPSIRWRYLVLDMLSDRSYENYHHLKTLSDLHSAYVYIRIRNGIQKILN